MSAGKSDVLCHRLHTGNGKWSWVDGPANAQAQQDSETFGWRIENAVPESLLLDARAERDAAKISASHIEIECREAWRQATTWREKAERAEALAGEYERDARRYRIWRDRSNPQTDALRIEAADLYGDDIDTAIDAVGGRGER